MAYLPESQINWTLAFATADQSLVAKVAFGNDGKVGHLWSILKEKTPIIPIIACAEPLPVAIRAPNGCKHIL